MIDKLEHTSRFKYIRVGEGLVAEADRDTIYISLS
jgi:hypothetical protein